jgi:hypothetical protein
LEVGKAYTIRARPAPGHLFAGWGGISNASNAVLTFRMAPNLKLVARFATNRFPTVVGTYAGLFFETNAPSLETSGAIHLQLASKGSFTGKLRMKAKSFPFKGQFDAGGNAAFPVIRPGMTPVVLALKVAFDGTDQIRGFVTNAVGTNLSLAVSELRANRAVRPATELAGGRPFRLLQTTPEGTVEVGHGIVGVFALRGVRISLSLNEQPTLIFDSALSKFGEMPFYATAGQGQELFIGWLQLGEFDLLPGHVFRLMPGAQPVSLEVLPETE